MGFFSSLFGKSKSNIGMEYVKKYGSLMLEPICGDMPKTDRKGNAIANITRLKVSGTTHQHLNSNPAKEIKMLKGAQNLVLVPNPENEHDPEAVRVMTFSGKQIGWIPRDYPGKNLIFRRLMEQYEIFCCVYDCGISKAGFPWCEITIVTYATPFEASLETRHPNSYSTFLLKLKGRI